MPNKILKAGQDRLRLEAALRGFKVRKLILNDGTPSQVWHKALAAFHIANQVLVIEGRLLRVIRKRKES